MNVNEQCLGPCTLCGAEINQRASKGTHIGLIGALWARGENEESNTEPSNKLKPVPSPSDWNKEQDVYAPVY